MRTTYDILLSLTVTHSFFSDKMFESFELVPDRKTAFLVNNFKLISKKQKNKWNLFLQTEGPFATTLTSLINKEFWFTFQITDTSFYSITNKSYLPSAGEMLFFDSPINAVVIPEKRKIYSLKFSYTIQHQQRPVNIRVTTAKGVELINDTIIDASAKQKQIDLSTNGENIYNISEDTVPPRNLENEKIFAKEYPADESFYGVIYFKILPVDANTGNQYQVNFASDKLIINN